MLGELAAASAHIAGVQCAAKPFKHLLCRHTESSESCQPFALKPEQDTLILEHTVFVSDKQLQLTQSCLPKVQVLTAV